jgi:hypothetical protein
VGEVVSGEVVSLRETLMMPHDGTDAAWRRAPLIDSMKELPQTLDTH